MKIEITINEIGDLEKLIELVRGNNDVHIEHLATDLNESAEKLEDAINQAEREK